MVGTHALDQVTPTRGGGRCIIDQILDRLHAEQSPDLQPLLRALRDQQRVSYRHLAAWLTEQGDPIGDSAVYAYRRSRKLDAWCARNGVTILDA